MTRLEFAQKWCRTIQRQPANKRGGLVEVVPNLYCSSDLGLLIRDELIKYDMWLIENDGYTPIKTLSETEVDKYLNPNKK